jgi:hypothetical protein
MAQRRRNPRKEHFWQQAVARWQRSGLSVRTYCARERLSEASFYGWRRELQRRPCQPVPTFVPLTVVSDAPAAAAPLELVLDNGRVIRIRADFDAATLRRLLAALEESPC